MGLAPSFDSWAPPKRQSPSAMDYQSHLEQIQATGLYRELQEVGSPQQAEIQLQTRKVLNFCSNNYLGLAADPRITAAAQSSAEAFGWGAGSAALISGDMGPHQDLRNALLKYFAADAVLLFNSGYHANIGAIPALLRSSNDEAQGCIFSDELNHASIIDGCRLAPCPTHIYRHGDTNHLAELLQKHSGTGPRWIVTESIFSMDGDCAPLQEIAELAHRYECGLYIDEAHAVGVFGENGRGLWETIDTRQSTPQHVVRIGTLGKAFGSYGAFALADASLIDYLLNRARSYIYTTGLPPAVAAASTEALKVAAAEPERRQKLWQHIQTFSEATDRKIDSPIIPWLVPGNEAVLAADKKLLNEGFYVHAIRAPTVAPGTERLRITLSAMHSHEQVKQLIDALK